MLFFGRFQILRQSTVHLADGPFSVLVDHTRVLDFDIKRRYFRTELERMDDGIRREDLAVHVRRDQVFEDSFRELHRRTPDEWKNRQVTPPFRSDPRLFCTRVSHSHCLGFIPRWHKKNWENASHVFMAYFYKLNLHRFYIVFEGEEGQDAGGLLREWYVIISREIFNPMYALFKVRHSKMKGKSV